MAWSKPNPWASSPVLTVPESGLGAKTFMDIMREEEDSRVATKLSSPVDDEEEQLRLAIAMSMESDDSEKKRRQVLEDELLARAIALELNASSSLPQEISKESAKSTPAESGIDDTLAAELLVQKQTFNEDEQLARFLQIEERRLLGPLQEQTIFKELTPMEQKLFKLEFEDEEYEDYDSDEDIDIRKEVEKLHRGELDYSDDEEEGEYKYDEPYSLKNIDPEDLARLNLNALKPLQPRLFDAAQRREDAELAHVTRRDKLKRPNATFVALHHKNYETRNAGKQQAESFKPYDGSTKNKNARRNLKDRRHYLMQLPFLYEEFYAFALVERVLGSGKRFIAYSYQNGGYFLSHLTDFAERWNANLWVEKGDIVVIKYRGKRMIHDVLMKLTEEEYALLPRKGCMSNHDPVRLLPPELMGVVFRLLPEKDLHSCVQVSYSWKVLLPHVTRFEEGPTFSPIS